MTGVNKQDRYGVFLGIAAPDLHELHALFILLCLGNKTGGGSASWDNAVLLM